jgi:hypothetical protein
MSGAPDFATPAMDFAQMLTLGRAIAGLDGAQEVLMRACGCDADSDPTVLAMRSARAALEIIYSEEVPPAAMASIAKILKAEHAEAGHA